MFLIVSLPRSRSAWLAHYLTYPTANKQVGHETLLGCDNFEDFKGLYDKGLWGTVETGGAILWRLVREEMPDCKIVSIRRPAIECYRSAIKAGFVIDMTDLATADAMLDAATMDPQIVSIDYKSLDDPVVCKWIFEHCLEEEFDFDWWNAVSKLNIQIDVPAWMKISQEMRPTREKLLANISERSKGLGICLN